LFHAAIRKQRCRNGVKPPGHSASRSSILRYYLRRSHVYPWSASWAAGRINPGIYAEGWLLRSLSQASLSGPARKQSARPKRDGPRLMHLRKARECLRRSLLFQWRGKRLKPFPVPVRAVRANRRFIRCGLPFAKMPGWHGSFSYL
jgi:hypothetical protein